MVEQLLKSDAKKVRQGNSTISTVVYNLIFRNALYSIECYREDSDLDDPNNYCLAEDITDDEGEAEAFLQIVARGKVSPVHIQDIAADYFAV
ncbi:hypothetical protein HNQ56_003033 [Anaerotaenia torta]|uniref:DUF6514 family protein n=1 Tax=Anaerotaenia torta TaxID=433293 RepID=UPI003D22C26B